MEHLDNNSWDYVDHALRNKIRFSGVKNSILKECGRILELTPQICTKIYSFLLISEGKKSVHKLTLLFQLLTAEGLDYT